MISLKELEREVRHGCKEVGLVFRKSKSSNLYVFTDRKTKEIIISNCTLSSALDMVYSGYILCYDKDRRVIDRELLEKNHLI